MAFFGSGKYTVNSKLQLILDAITLTLSLAFVYVSFLGFSTSEVSPKLTYLTPQQIIEKEGPGVPVAVGIYINAFPEFDIVKARFTVDLSIWFRFDPKQITFEQIDKFTFASAEIKSKNKSLIKIEGKNIVVYYDMRVSFFMSLGYKTFPVDDHRISFILI